MKTILFIFSITAILLLVPVKSEAQSAGTEAPDFTLSTLGGGEFSLSGQKGKVVFIFFFGYACPHCLINGSNTENDVYAEYMDLPGFVAIGIDTWDGNESGVQSFKNSTGISYPLALQGSGVVSAYQTTYDRIVIVDPEGIIRYTATANATSDIVAEATGIIDIYIDQVVGLKEEANNNELDVFYHHVNRQILVTDNSESVISYLRIIDLSGNMLYESKGESLNVGNTFQIDTDHLSSGIYIFQAAMADKLISKKFVVGN